MTSKVLPFVPRQRRTDEGTYADRDRERPAEVIDLPTPAVYTVREAATLLSLSPGSVYALVRDGTIPAERLGRRWVIPRARFHAWLDRSTVEPDPNVSATGTDQYGRRR